MKISEQQIHNLINILTEVSSARDVALSETGFWQTKKLLADIANQQSTELKEVE
jgi:hypothetical protein